MFGAVFFIFSEPYSRKDLPSPDKIKMTKESEVSLPDCGTGDVSAKAEPESKAVADTPQADATDTAAAEKALLATARKEKSSRLHRRKLRR